MELEGFLMKLNELTIVSCREGLKHGDFTSVGVVNACYDHIEKYDKKFLNAFVTVLDREKVLKIAKEADKQIANDSNIFIKKPLLGIPFAAKDNYSTKGIKTTASSNMLSNYVPPYNATVIDRLEFAGAILIGKTNMDAFAHGSSNETSDFYPTKNPWDITRVPGGSSGGSAAAVAANMCIFAIGSETAGSIRGPASWCGVTGLKPSYGRVSRYGVVAMASSTDSPGPLTKNIEDASILLGVIAGKDQNDATTSPSSIVDYTQTVDLKGKKIGLPKSYFNIELQSGIKDIVMDAVKKLEELGMEVVEMDLLDPKYSIAVYTVLQRSEVSSNLARLDGIRFGNDRTHFGFEAKKRIMLGAYTLSSGYYDAYYSKAQKVRTLLIDDLNNAFQKVDYIISPTMPCVAMKLGEAEKSPMFGELMDVLAEQSSVAGICGLSVNCGFLDELPVGVQIMGKMFDEAGILNVGRQFQQNTDYIKFPNLEETCK